MKDHIREIINDLKLFSDKRTLEGLSRFGINTSYALGVKIPVLRAYAKKFGKDHELALGLWNSGIHEARIMAAYVDDYKKVTSEQMDAWVRDFNSWDLCDQVCGNLFDKTVFAKEKALEWSEREEEYVKRAGFTLMATLAVHRKNETDEWFYPFFKQIENHAYDERNFVKKAVNWALRQLGKRNAMLNEKAIECATLVCKQNTKPALWIAKGALRELQSEAVFNKIDIYDV